LKNIGAENQWCPFRLSPADLEAIGNDVADIPDIQRKILANNPDLKFPDRVAHQYQIAGGRLFFKLRTIRLDLCAVSGFFSLARSTGAWAESPPDWAGRMWETLASGAQQNDSGMNDNAAQDRGRGTNRVISPEY
jgi:hypothetical protein